MHYEIRLLIFSLMIKLPDYYFLIIAVLFTFLRSDKVDGRAISGTMESIITSCPKHQMGKENNEDRTKSISR